MDDRGRIERGWRFSLSNDKDEYTNSPRYADQFQPYREVFQDISDGIEAGYFDGTLFRFPLRQVASELSTSTYTNNEKMGDLLEAFRADADVVTLFLRSLKEVEVMTQQTVKDSSSLIVRVKEEHEQSEDFLQMNETFCSDLQQYCSTDIKFRQRIDLTKSVTIRCETPDGVNCQRWIISHLIAGSNDMSQNLLKIAEEQNLIPWTGVAIPIRSKEGTTNTHLGRVFCFLPLPPGEESRTGLPVHVHGSFGINSDRRSLKWPGPDQTSEPAKWNELLVKELLPRVYVSAIKCAINMQINGQEVSIDSIYRAWPDLDHVMENWKILLKGFFQELFKHSIIYSNNKGWMNVKEVYINDLDVESEVESAILKCLQKAGIPYATIPLVCKHAIDAFSTDETKTITSSLLCRCLGENQDVLEGMTSEDKLLILEFILTSESDLSDLEGLPLLPLDDDTFMTFDSHGQTVYIPNDCFPRKLIPGAHQHFVKTVPEGEELARLLTDVGEYVDI